MSSDNDSKSEPSTTQFKEWRGKWLEEMGYQGREVPGVDTRIEKLLALWRLPVPGNWQRKIDAQLLGPQRYRRGDIDAPRNGEHRIEKEILDDPIDIVTCMGATVVDGINAMPLVRDEAGGRSANVEADVLLLLRDDNGHKLALLEIKDSANNPWYAAVENLLQMKLLSENPVQQRLFHERGVALSAEALPVVGLVVAPEAYYHAPGQKGLAVPHAQLLCDRFLSELGVELRLAVWDAPSRAVKPYHP